MLPGIKKRVVNFSDVMMYVAVGLKYGRLVVLIFCLSMLAGLSYYVFAKPVYYGVSVVQYRAVPLPVDSQTVFKDSSDEAVIAEFMASDLIGRTAYRLGYRGDEREIDKTFVRKVKVSFDPQRNIMIEVWPYVPHITAPWGETMFNEFMAAREERRARYRDTVIKSFIKEQDNIGKRMQELHAQRAEFRESNEVMRAVMDLTELTGAQGQLMTLNHRLQPWIKIKQSLDDPNLDVITKLSMLAGLKDAEGVDIGEVMYGVTASQFGTISTGPLSQALPAPLQRPAAGSGVIVIPEMVKGSEDTRAWINKDNERRQLLAQIKELEKTYLPAHPKLSKPNEKLQELDKQLAVEYQAARNRFDLEYARMVERKRELEAKVPAYVEAMKRYEELQQHTTEYDSKQLAWQNMFGEIAKSITAYYYGAQNERAQMSFLGNRELRNVTPVSPNRLKLVLISLAIAGMLSLGVPFLFEYLDYTVNDVAEVEDVLQLRGLGIVPKVMEGTSEKIPLLGGSDRNSRHLLENFRVIRTNLILNPSTASETEQTKAHQVILVASAVPKEGKTAISANLAISFAQKGEKTLIIDADLRRGRLHRLFATRTSPGLSNVMVENLPIENACRPSFHDNLDILTCGKHISGATELLGTLAFENLVADLRKRYDKIVIDTPPVLGLSETSMMQKLCDGVLFVISSEQTPMRSVKAAIELLRANGAKFYGFVLNRIDLTNNANYYNYYYYSYHYYDRYQALEKAS